MVLSFGAAKGEEDVLTLIGKKNYAKAIEVLKRGKADPRAKNQLADVLVLAGKPREAVAVLLPLADEYAREGFAAKAVAVLKKIQKIDPSRREVEQKLASLIEEKQRVATVSLPLSPSAGGLPEIGIEEIGMEPPPGFGGGRAPAGPVLEMEAGPELALPVAVHAPVAEPEPLVAAPEPIPPPPGPVASAPSFLDLSVASPSETLPLPDAQPLVLELEPAAPAPARPAPRPEPAPVPAAPVARPSPLVDTDFFTDEDLQMDEGEPEMVSAEPLVDATLVEAEIVAEPAEPADPMSDARFADELMGLVDSLFDTSAAAAAGPPDDTPEVGQQIVVSPLFAALSVDEMVAVIAGLHLLTFKRGDVIIRQGEPGTSLYMLTSGKVRAFVKKDGKNVPVADLSEGAFFGEGSILTGKPRSATVAALTSCELLELDRPTLDDITARHPHVMDVMREFAARRIR